MSGMGYGCLKLSLKSTAEIINGIQKYIADKKEEGVEIENVITIANNELHATLMYDKSNPNIEHPIDRSVYKGTVTGVERLGNQSGDYYALVILFESEAIQKRFDALTAMGFKHSWPEPKLHISMGYGDQTDIGYPLLKAAYEAGYLPTEISLLAETWNECH